MSFKYNVIIKKEEEWYVAKCIDNNIASQGNTIIQYYHLRKLLKFCIN